MSGWEIRPASTLSAIRSGHATGPPTSLMPGSKHPGTLSPPYAHMVGVAPHIPLMSWRPPHGSRSPSAMAEMVVQLLEFRRCRTQYGRCGQRPTITSPTLALRRFSIQRRLANPVSGSSRPPDRSSRSIDTASSVCPAPVAQPEQERPSARKASCCAGQPLSRSMPAQAQRCGTARANDRAGLVSCSDEIECRARRRAMADVQARGCRR